MLFIQKKFREYYKNANIELPKRFGRREFAFMFFDKDFVLRHLCFKAKDDFRKFLLEKIPSHIYYSSAYYEFPNAQTMNEKNWLGADLIFDLDSDHISGTKELSYEEQLKRVKEEVLKLLNNFLLSDFGFKEQEIKIVFSGGRGYHIHISDERVLQLNSHERRGIIDYIHGTGIDYDRIIQKVAVDKKFGKYGKVIHQACILLNKPIFLNNPTSWKEKIANGVINFISELENKNEEETIKILSKHKGVGEKIAKEIYTTLFYGEIGKRGIDKIKDEKNLKKGILILDIFDDDKTLNLFLEMIKDRVKVQLQGEADEPVTSDIKRLIRLPYSLHGKTGLLVKPLEYEELKEFSPLRDAIVFSDSSVKINIKKSIKIKMKEEFNLKEGITEVPEYLAVFLIGRNFAEFVK